MKRASANNPAFIEKLRDKHMSFEISSDDGVCRSYHIQNQKVTSKSGASEAPEFGLRFKTAEDGFRILTNKNAKLAFMQGFQDKKIRVEGNTASLMWFQNIVGMVIPKKKKKTVAA